MEEVQRLIRAKQHTVLSQLLLVASLRISVSLHLY